jgi:hypothetical protein
MNSNLNQVQQNTMPQTEIYPEYQNFLEFNLRNPTQSDSQSNSSKIKRNENIMTDQDLENKSISSGLGTSAPAELKLS